MLLSISFSPLTQSVKTTSKKIDEDCYDLGSIKGRVSVSCFPPPVYIKGAKVTLDGDFIKRITFSGIFGKFKFNAVPIGRQYILNVTHPKYKNVSKTVTLTEEDPDLKIGIYMSEKDITKLKTTKKDCCVGGIISGWVGEVTGGYSGVIIPFARVKIEGFRSKICSVIGTYMFTALPLNITYEVTADANGYDSDTQSVTLTRDNRHENLIFYLEKNNENKAKKNVMNIKCIFSLIPVLFPNIFHQIINN